MRIDGMTAPGIKVRLEQLRQARRIHGGALKFLIALLGVKLARVKIPSKRLRLSVYRGLFKKKYPPGLDEEEAERPLWMYPSLNALFTRGLKPECRPMPLGTPQFLSPCDGAVQDVGRVTGGKLLTVKGIEYTLESLLPGTDSRRFEGGHYVVIFLAPVDCHRVFSPQDGQFEEVVHVPGYRLLVHPPYQRAEYPVYTLNERMILRFTTAFGPCVVAMIAGWGVGNITLPLAPGFRPRARTAASHRFTPAAAVRRGDWVGTFELGSTVVLLAPPAADARCLVCPNEAIKYGQPLLTYGDSAVPCAARTDSHDWAAGL
jgi:phosphatidylserine decarboxylase